MKVLGERKSNKSANRTLDSAGCARRSRVNLTSNDYNFRFQMRNKNQALLHLPEIM